MYVQYTMARDECCRSDLVFFEEVVAVFAEQVDAGYHGGAVAQTRRYQTRMTIRSRYVVQVDGRSSRRESGNSCQFADG